MAVFAVAVAPGDIIKYQSFVYGSFVWEIHVRYNNAKYMDPDRTTPKESSLIWVHSVCFHDKIGSGVHFHICSKQKKKMSIQDQKLWWDKVKVNLTILNLDNSVLKKSDVSDKLASQKPADQEPHQDFC